MLSKSNINPFDSQEAKPYKNDPEIIAMTRLRYSFDIRPPLYIIKWGASSSILPQAEFRPNDHRKHALYFMSEFLEKHIKITILNNFKEF